MHVTSLVNELLLASRAQGQPIPSVGTLTSPTPDIRLSVSPAAAGQDGSRTIPMVEVRIENHSPVQFFLDRVEVIDEHFYVHFAERDAITGQLISGRTIEPGDSLAIHFELRQLLERGSRQLREVVAIDKIRRSFRAPTGSLELAIAEARHAGRAQEQRE
jgi:hypothetical protein